MHLYLSHYTAQTRARQQEMAEALAGNLNASFVREVTLFVEGEAPVLPRTHVNVTVVPSQRLTYQAIFDFANTHTGKDELHAIVNSDISLRKGFEGLSSVMTSETFIALSRYEASGVYDAYPANSQDVWIWRGRCRIDCADFYMGIRGCDNRLAAEAYLAGYTVVNPCRNLVTHHHHRSQDRGEDYNAEYVDPPYVGVSPCFLGGKSDLQRMVGSEQWVAQFRRSQRTDEASESYLDQVRRRLAN